MGHHYVPQRYLRNFGCRTKPGFIWLHDKATGDAREVSIKQVAQTRHYYAPEVERLLADVVERPTNAVIEKLCAGCSIHDVERRQLALYIGTMLMRVPAHRDHALDQYPVQLADYIGRFRAEIESLAASRPEIDHTIVNNRLELLDTWAVRHAYQPPPEIIEQIRSPWPYNTMLVPIETMTWRVLEATGPEYFITSDNPAFYFGAYGLGRRESELSFPLSRTHTLHGSWQDAGSLLVHLKAKPTFVKEVNRRLASTSARAFYHERAPWLSRLLQKKHPFLSVLYWSEPPRWRNVPALVPDGRRRATT